MWKKRLTVIAAVVLATAAGPVLAAAVSDETPPRAARRGAPPAQPLPMSDEGGELRVYDVRDVVASVGSGAQPHGAGAAADQLVVSLSNRMGLPVMKLMEGIFAVQATTEGHAVFQATLNSLRELAAETYQFEMQVFSIPREQARGVGSAWRSEGAPAAVHLTAAAARRAPVQVKTLQEITYVGEWSPVVGASAVGYEAKLRSEEEGLTARVVLGAGPDAPGGELVRIDGELSLLNFDETVSPAVDPSGRNLMIKLPRRSIRTISADLRVPLGTPTVVATMSGFEADRVLAVVVTVNRQN